MKVLCLFLPTVCVRKQRAHFCEGVSAQSDNGIQRDAADLHKPPQKSTFLGAAWPNNVMAKKKI